MSQELLYKVAYDESVRALSEQQVTIDSLRARAGLLFSAAAVTTSFLGAEALRGSSLGFSSWLALFSFLAMAATSLAILWPRKWEVAEDLHRDLSLHMHRSYLKNHEGLEQLIVFLRLASGLLTLEVVFWIAAIAAGH